MTLFLAKALREWGASPRCFQTALQQTNVGSLGELLHRTPFPVLEKPSFLKPGLRWAVGTPAVHQAVFEASSSVPRPYSAPLTHTAWARLKSPLLQMQVHCPAGNGPIKKSFTRHKRVCVPLDWDLPRLYHKLECFLEECKERGKKKKKDKMERFVANRNANKGAFHFPLGRE